MHRFPDTLRSPWFLLLAGLALFVTAKGFSQEVSSLKIPENLPALESAAPVEPPDTPNVVHTIAPADADNASKEADWSDSISAEDQKSNAAPEVKTKAPVETEIIWEGMASYGNYNLFAIEDMTKLYTSGIEMDRHVWGYFMKAQMDYVAEVLPFVLLVEPAKSSYFGTPLTGNRKLVPGLGITPVGLRMMWRSNRERFKPYVLIKGGMVGFTQKALSPAATYEDFTLQSGFGVQTKLTRRVDLRLGLWGDFHFSNAYVVASDPGTDVMNANWGLCYHFGKPRQ
jgi:hypothetical protein